MGMVAEICPFALQCLMKKVLAYCVPARQIFEYSGIAARGFV